MKIIDLSHILNENATIYPGAVKPKIKLTGSIEKNGYTEHVVTLGTHTGTHIDAPSHMLINGKSLDQLPIDKFIGKAIVVSCQDKEEIDLAYLQSYEAQISKVNFILFFTGWDEKWNTSEYFGDYPTLSPEAAEWLTKFKLDGLGFDVLSVDKVNVKNPVIHHILLKKEILIIENLTNLNQLPDRIFLFHCTPLKIENADGSPVRAIAIINE